MHGDSLLVFIFPCTQKHQNDAHYVAIIFVFFAALWFASFQYKGTTMIRAILLGGITTMLAASIDGQTREPLPFRVPLNHFYLVLDSKTYADIENSAFLRKEFAVSETRT